MRSIIIFLISSLFFTCSLSAAEISLGKAGWGDPAIFINGIIEKGDKDKLISIAREITENGNVIVIYLNSSGGDVAEALEIGKFIKIVNARTMIQGVITRDPKEENSKCLSACFIIFASGSIRDHAGENILFDKMGQEIIQETPVLGVHRPYFNPKTYSGLTPKEARLKYESLNTTVRLYLRSISVPEEIIDKMFVKSSKEIAYITKKEYVEKIGYRQPFFEEWLLSKCGSLTSSEIKDLGAVMGDRIYFNDKNLIPEGMSPGYVKYLENKSNDKGQCEKDSVLLYQKKQLGL